MPSRSQTALGVWERVHAGMATSLSREEIGRYGRQLILPEWGVEAQERVCATSVLIVGVGGLGCPSSLYLAAAGTGHLGLLDYDAVELSNLHRQVLHTEQRVGVPKADSAQESLSSLNSKVKCTTHHVLLSSQNALEIISSYDVVVDATDNVASRYLLNDACVLLGKPLVSGSALRFEGQLTVYNYNGGPCYRCLFPKPPPPDTVTNCSEGGVLGVVPGVIGSLQALEVLKIVAGIGGSHTVSYSQRLLLFNGLEGTFQTIKLRPRQSSCVVCGDSPSLTRLVDYEQFCGSRADDKDRRLNILKDSDKISCKDYKALVDAGIPHLLLDVREPVEFKICRLPKSENVSLSSLQSGTEGLRAVAQLIRDCTGTADQPVSVYVLCRRGNDSQLAVKLLRSYLRVYEEPPTASATITNIDGGLESWTNTVDPDFPNY